MAFFYLFNFLFQLQQAVEQRRLVRALDGDRLRFRRQSAAQSDLQTGTPRLIRSSIR